MKKYLSTHRILSVVFAFGVFAAGSLLGAPAPKPDSQESYKTADDAVAALTAALKADDTTTLYRIFGPDLGTVLSADPVERKSEYEAFTKAYAEKVAMVNVSDSRVTLDVGPNAWPLPFPLVKGADGSWRFDTAAGREEILNRRIGENELGSINVLLRYVDAQREYASNDWDGSQVLTFAQRLISTPGKKDGLFWESGDDGTISPMAELVAEARAIGYNQGKTKAGETQQFEGYVYKILKKQGPDAPLGRYNYVVNGKMIAGFGLVAYPIKYGNSGIMTFMVNQQGIVYQKDLGPNATALGDAMTEYNPGAGWKPVEVDVSEVTPVVGKN